MATDGDKIAAATLTAALVQQLATLPNDAARIDRAIELYGAVLQRIANINPATGAAFTQQELQTQRQLGRT